MNTKLIVTSIALTFACAPVVSAAPWLLGSGVPEPNTSFDNTPGFMFLDGNAAAVDKVYFNGVIVSAIYGSGATAFNYNLDGGSIMGASANFAEALLGYWRDCNHDGYVGLKTAPTSTGSLGAYPAQLSSAAGHPIDSAVCPLGSAYQQINPDTGAANGIIHEWRQVGPCVATTTDSCNPAQADPAPAKVCLQAAVPALCNANSPPAGATVVSTTRPAQRDLGHVVDNYSRVWGDWERPAAAHVPYQGITPLPRGTTADSDGTLGWIDGATLGAISSSAPAVWDAKPNVGACDQPHPVFLGGPDGTCGAYPLYQVVRLGNDTSCNAEGGNRPAGCSEPDPLVQVFDLQGHDSNPCDDFVNQSVVVPNPANPSGGSTTVWLQLPNPAPAPNANILADGSIAGTEKNVVYGTNGVGGATPVRCGSGATNMNGGGTVGQNVVGNCGIYNCEADAQGSAVMHVEPTFTMNFTVSGDTRSLSQFGFDTVVLEPNAMDPGTDSMWTSNTIWSDRPPRLGWGYASNAYATFYADLTTQGISGAQRFPLTPGNAATALPAGTNDAHTYGTDYCAAITTGPSNINTGNQWECSKTQWDTHRHEDDATQYNPILGDAYDLRDVDCYDNSVSSSAPGVHAGAADCTGT